MNRDWKYKKLKDVCQIARGGSPRPITDYITDSQNGINWIKIGDAIEGDKYIRSTKEKIKPEGMSKSRFVHRGDFILSNSMSFGRPYILDIDGCIHDGWLVLQDTNNQYIKDFLYYLLGSPWMYAEFKALAVGGVVNNLNSKLVGNVMVPVPPIEVQQSIVLELDKINNLLNLKRQQLEIYDKLAQSLFYDMFGDPVENEKGWGVKKLGELCIIERGGSPRPITEYITDSEDGLNWIKIGDASEDSMYINSTKEKIKREGIKKTRMVHKGDFILSNSMSFGRPYILAIDGCIHDGWLVIHDENDIFDKVYLYHALSHRSMYAQFTMMAVGGVVNNLNSSMVRNVSVVVPPKQKQQDFTKRIELIEAQKQHVKNAINKLQVLLNNRMDYWFVIQPVAEQIVKNAMTEDRIKEIYNEYKQDKGIQNGMIHYANGYPNGCTDNNMDFRLLADIYNYMVDSGETTIESIEKRYSYTSHAKHCVLELKELGLLSSDDLKTFHIV